MYQHFDLIFRMEVCSIRDTKFVQGRRLILYQEVNKSFRFDLGSVQIFQHIVLSTKRNYNHKFIE